MTRKRTSPSPGTEGVERVLELVVVVAAVLVGVGPVVHTESINLSNITRKPLKSGVKKKFWFSC